MVLRFVSGLARVGAAIVERLGGPKIGGGLPVGVVPPPFEIQAWLVSVRSPRHTIPNPTGPALIPPHPHMLKKYVSCPPNSPLLRTQKKTFTRRHTPSARRPVLSRSARLRYSLPALSAAMRQRFTLSLKSLRRRSEGFSNRRDRLKSFRTPSLAHFFLNARMAVEMSCPGFRSTRVIQ